METNEERQRPHAYGDRPREERAGRLDTDTITLRLPRLDPELRTFLFEMLPGRALFRVLGDLPEDVLSHARNARREQLLALRSLVDALIQETERPRRSEPRVREIEIE
jgi:hypothetical protein